MVNFRVVYGANPHMWDWFGGLQGVSSDYSSFLAHASGVKGR